MKSKTILTNIFITIGLTNVKVEEDQETSLDQEATLVAEVEATEVEETRKFIPKPKPILSTNLFTI